VIGGGGGGALLLLLAQAGGWTATPIAPTVGDTIRLERTIAAPPGWRVRAGRLPSGAVAEPLGDVVIVASAAGAWSIRYTVVAWAPGDIALDMPPLWRLGPDGSADSLAGGSATFHVASVIPDSVRSPAPQPSLGPLRLQRASPIPVIAAALLAGGALLLLIGWRRRALRSVIDDSALALDAEVPDQRWLAAGEPKAVAARAARRLRSALARAVPSAHEALSTTECLMAVEQAWPNAPLRELRELLQALDQVAFATAHGVDVAPLAARARTMARELGGNGKPQ
jgi:hypothetical protein